MGEFDLHWTNWVVFGHFGEVEFKVDESILCEEINCWLVFRVEFLETVDGFGDLELIKFKEFDGLVFLFGDEFSFSDDIFLMREEGFKSFTGLFEDLLFVILDFDVDRLNNFLLLFGEFGLLLFFTHCGKCQ